MHQHVDDFDLLEEFERLIAENEAAAAATNPQPGDAVVYNGHPAKVIRVRDDGQIRIKFDRDDLIPPKMNVPPEHLSWDGQRTINPHYSCPKCDVPWKEIKGFRLSVYYNCPKCGMDKEKALEPKTGIKMPSDAFANPKKPGVY